MFEREVEQFKTKVFLEKLFKMLYSNVSLPDCIIAMRINPAVLAFARSQDVTLDAEIRKAQAFQADNMVDILPNISDHYDDARMAAVVSDNIKWIATKRYRDIYGDKMDVNVQQTIDIKDVLAIAKARVNQFTIAKPLPVLDAVTDIISDTPMIPHVQPDIDPLS